MPYQRGVFTSEAGNRGLMQSFRWTPAVTTEEARDASGNVAAADDYDYQSDAEFVVVYNTSATTPAMPNGTFTISGCQESDANAKFTLRGKSQEESNTAYTRATLTGHRYHANSLPA